VSDRDLTNGQIGSLASAFRDFIVDNRGANLSRSGAAVWGEGTVTSTQVNYVRAVSQFVGYTLGGWRNAEIIVSSNLSGDTAGSTDWWRTRLGEGYTHRINPSFMDHAGNPSSLARTLFHEFGHRRDMGGMVFSIDDSRHQGIDLWARRRVMQRGLGGGGCPAIGGWLWGLIPPSYPGCESL